jgi:hypothetical protein
MAAEAQTRAPTSDRLTVRDDPPGELILADALIVRPVGIVACIVGAVGTVLISPFTASTGSYDRVEEELLRKPAEFTFKRPLGEMDQGM